jgi:Zn-dependent protease
LKQNFQFTKVLGVSIKFHWSFIFIFVLVAYISIIEKLDTAEILFLVLGIASVFVCVLLHELGHALMARRIDVQIVDILLTPIGGLARFGELYDNSRKEVIIALAGPLVNFVLFVILFLPFLIFGRTEIILEREIGVVNNFWGYLHFLLTINIVLFLFNLIPAFPMDGGRILRGLLSLKFDRMRATYIAMITGKIFAVLFLILAYTHQMFALLFIGGFVYFMADREYKYEVSKLH